MTELEEYYNKFNEEKRLNSRHGRVEFITSMKYIHDCLGSLMNEKQLDLRSQIKILDVGAGTGRDVYKRQEDRRAKDSRNAFDTRHSRD